MQRRPQHNETPRNEDPGITNDILQPSNSKMYGENPDIMNPYLTNTPV